MRKQNKFEDAYLKAIKLIKEDVDDASTEKTGTPENQVKVITFKTADPGLIDAFTNGFEKITISKMGEQEKIEDFEFVKDLFGDISVTAEEEVTECGDIDSANTEATVNTEDDETEITDCDNVKNEDDEIETDTAAEVTEEKCETCNGTGICKDETDNECDCEDCKGTGIRECGDITAEEDETEELDEEEDEVEITECNAFESALKRIKEKYLI